MRILRKQVIMLPKKFGCGTRRGPSKKFLYRFWIVFLPASLAFAQHAPAPSPALWRLPLRDGWTLQSSRQVEQTGDVLSTPGFRPKGWYEVSVPTTVVAALVKRKVLPDPFFGMNLRQFPGMAYPIGDNFSSLPMPPADYTALSQLPQVKLRVTSRSERKGEESLTHVTLQNPTQSLAFFVRLKVTRGAGGEEILPVIWQDNYISLRPGEKREITASYRTAKLGPVQPAVEVSGWNVQPWTK
jgi:exo-1,4-beta-D-glucosaminidase